jgi:proton glutamate symport protein
MRRISLTTWIFIGLVGGIGVGWGAPDFAVKCKPLGELFLRMIKLLVSPLVFATLVVGIAGVGGGKSFGRLFLKAMAWFWAATAVALTLGLLTVNLTEPGTGVTIAAQTSAQQARALAGGQPSGFWGVVLHAVPTSVVDAMARNDVLPLVVFSVLFGVALAGMGDRGRPLVEVLNLVSEVMFRITGLVMKFAPVGVAAAIGAALGEKGLAVLWPLGKMILSLYAALAVFITLLLLAVKAVTGISLVRTISVIREPLVLAFSTTSSEAALPKAMQCMQALGVPRHIVGFVMPTGYSFNLDGSTLYMSLAGMFCVQAAGLHLTAGEQLGLMLTMLLTSKGVAAVPRASFVVLSATLDSNGLPLGALPLLLGVDAVMDMARTSVNVLGNCMACAVVAKWEGVLPADAPIYGQTPMPEPGGNIPPAAEVDGHTGEVTAGAAPARAASSR